MPAQLTTPRKKTHTLTAQVKHRLQESIRSGKEYLPGSRLPTLRELAGQFKVSHTTVSDALDELVIEGWVERRERRDARVAKELPYKVVAFISEEAGRPWLASIAEYLELRGLEEGLSKDGYRVQTYGLFEADEVNSQLANDSIDRVLELAKDNMLTGIVIRGATEIPSKAKRSFEELLAGGTVPLVQMECDPFPSEYCVRINCEEVARQQAKYLIEKNSRNLAIFVTASESVAESIDRIVDAFAAVIRQAGLSLDEKNVFRVVLGENLDDQYGPGVYEHIFYERFDSFWRGLKTKGDLPDGLAFMDDVAARSATYTLMSYGYHPDELNLSSMTNKNSGIFSPLPFARCEVDSLEIGHKTAGMILARVNGDEGMERKFLIAPKMLPPLKWKIDGSLLSKKRYG